ncbi:MAG: SDR family oxidoreductase [Thermaerobacter sp.]|nr:SDR family oxidoreductase [Thermaerobacter sp.]
MLAQGTLNGQIAIVTGGATGIGLGIAQEVGRLGARVVLASRNQERLDAAVQQLASQGVESIGVKTDIRDPAQVDELVAKALDQYGQIDMLVNNAAGNFIVDAEKLSVNGFNAVVGIVLHGTFHCSRAVGLEMIRSGRGGKMLNLVAAYAWTGGPMTLHSAVAKAGVVAMTRTLAVEWAEYGIRVNALCPGPVDTEQSRAQLWAAPEMRERLLRSIPTGRFGTVEEVAQAASYLLSPYADFINGEVLVIDGGEWLGKGIAE